MRTAGRVGLLAGALAIASLSFLAGQWAYGFAQFMWLEDELGGSSGAIFDYLARTPPQVVPMLWFAVVVLAASLIALLACLVAMLRGKAGGRGSRLLPSRHGPTQAPSAT